MKHEFFSRRFPKLLFLGHGLLVQTLIVLFVKFLSFKLII